MKETAATAAARRAVGELAANGAVFNYRPPAGALPASFTYEIPSDGDRRRCRAIIVQAKADPAVWAAVLAEVASRTRATS